MNDTPHGEAPEEFDGGDADLEQILKSAVRVRPMSPESLARINKAVEAVWEDSYGKSTPADWRDAYRRHVPWGKVAALAGLLSLAIGWATLANRAEPQIIGTVARAGPGSIEIGNGPFWHRALVVGDPIRVGNVLWVHESALLLLSTGGTLRVAEGTRLVVLGESRLAFARGKIYIDKPPNVVDSKPLQVLTRVGRVEHVGTEYEIDSGNQELRVRVREGKVRFYGATGVIVAKEGTELVARPEGTVSQQAIQPYGRDWQWTAELAPEFEVEGRTVSEYLEWISRELGRSYEYADKPTRDRALRTVLHGNMSSKATLDSLADVLSSTSLSYGLVDGVIHVHSER